MNALTGEIAADAAWPAAECPPNPPVAMMNVYNGSARPPVDVMKSWNRPVLMGFESAVDRAFAGGDAGERDAAFSCGSYDEVGYPLECGSWACAADVNSVPTWALANIEEYAYRYALRMIAAGRTGPILWYGNPDAVDAAVRGTQRAGLLGLRWKVGTWGMGEGGGPNQPPAQADAELVQSGNTPGPLAVPSDLNWLYVLTAVFMAWFGPTPTPTVALSEELDMLVVHGPQQTLAGNRRAIAFLGAKPLQSWYGPSAYGKVQAAADWVTAFPTDKPREFVIPTDDPNDPVFSALVKLADAPAETPAAGTAGVDLEQLVAALAPHLQVTVDAAAIAKAVNDDAAARLAKV